MSVSFSNTSVMEKNSVAIRACRAIINRLEGMVGLPASREMKRLAQLNRARNQLTQLQTVNAHLTSGINRVRPLADATANELNALGNRLDQQIAADAITNATLDFITSVLNDVDRLRSVIDSNRV